MSSLRSLPWDSLRPLTVNLFSLCNCFTFFYGSFVALSTGWYSMVHLFSYFFLNLLIYFWEVGRDRERRRQRIPSRLHTVSAEPSMGLNPQTVRSWCEPRSRVRCLKNWTTRHPKNTIFYMSFNSHFYFEWENVKHTNFN